MRRAIVMAGLVALVAASAQAAQPATHTLDDLDLGAAAQLHGDLDGAMAHYKAAIASGKLSKHRLAVAYSDEGLDYYDKGDIAQALASLATSIDVDPTIAEAWGIRARAVFDQGDAADAGSFADRGLKLDPKEESSLYIEGRLAETSGDVDRGVSPARDLRG
jgi:tetratricopeptide (TPR) repeat protein